MGKVLFPIDLSKSNLDKKEFLIGKLNEYVSLSKSDFLEIGIGNGRFGYLLGRDVAHYYGIDIDDEYVKIAKTNIPKNAEVTYKVGSAEEIPFERKFDIVFYALSWHFIKDFGKALNELNRVLESKGVVVILEPSGKGNNWADPRLRQDSPQFDEVAYQNKINQLEKGRKEILGQGLFEIIEDVSFGSQQFYLLRRKNEI